MDKWQKMLEKILNILIILFILGAVFYFVLIGMRELAQIQANYRHPSVFDGRNQ